MSPRAAIAALIGFTLLSCAPESEVPFETVFVQVDVRDPFGSRPPGPLQVGLVWTTTSTVFASSAVELPEGENTVTLPLAFPSPRPPNIPAFEFRLRSVNILVHVPRVVVFRDDDESGGFTNWTVEEPIPDTVFGINGQGATSVAAVQDFEDVAVLPASDLNTYYDRTNGVNTPFVIFPGSTSTLTPDAVSLSGLPTVQLYFDDSDVPARDARCTEFTRFLREPTLASIADAGTSSQSFSIRVDDELPVESVCGITTPNCTAVDLSTTTATVPAEVLTAGRRVFTQCRSGSTLQSLVTLDAELVCDECECGWIESYRALIVRTSSIPAGWPCGDTVPFCVSPLPLFQIEEACLDPGE